MIFLRSISKESHLEEGVLPGRRGERHYFELNGNARERELVSRAWERPLRHRRGLAQRGPAVLSTDRGVAIAQ